jgi:hypothetical protein
MKACHNAVNGIYLLAQKPFKRQRCLTRQWRGFNAVLGSWFWTRAGGSAVLSIQGDGRHRRDPTASDTVAIEEINQLGEAGFFVP